MDTVPKFRAALTRLCQAVAPLKRRTHIVATVAALLLIVGESTSSAADPHCGLLSGAVTDGSGAVVQGATVVFLKNLGTNEERTAVVILAATSCSRCCPGRYTARAELSGFKAWTVRNSPSLLPDQFMLDSRLEVASAAETVNVMADPPVLQRQSTPSTGSSTS